MVGQRTLGAEPCGRPEGARVRRVEIKASWNLGRKEKTRNPKEMFTLVRISCTNLSQEGALRGPGRGSPRASVSSQGRRGKPGGPQGTPRPGVQAWPLCAQSHAPGDIHQPLDDLGVGGVEGQPVHLHAHVAGDPAPNSVVHQDAQHFFFLEKS